MTLVALVHGAYHGGWCWEPLGRELESLGHRWVAPDLPCEDQNAAVPEYAAAVGKAIDEAGLGDGEDLVVVGHSLAGFTAPVVAAERSARRLVLIAAILPEPGRKPSEATHPPEMSEHWDELAGRQIIEDGLSRWKDEDAIEIFFHDCDGDLARWAAARLRGQAYTLLEQPSPLSAMPDTEYRYLACRQDRTLSFGWQQKAARRLGVDPIVFPGGHSPFLAQPRDVAVAITDGLPAPA